MDSRNPLIETPRLRMRPHRLDDFDDMATMWADPRVVEHITGTPSTREQSWARLLRYAGHWAMMDFGYWAVEERESGAFIGEVGFADYHREIEPSLNGIPELGWILVILKLDVLGGVLRQAQDDISFDKLRMTW
ncbi:MAG: GNAT family N-acetyltransferase [Candidatus Eremiobacteraeota bacterium]|nr:GNAT family N-acetyltransferase [Candidatus Eremiobacteraeota bacterium]